MIMALQDISATRKQKILLVYYFLDIFSLTECIIKVEPKIKIDEQSIEIKTIRWESMQNI